MISTSGIRIFSKSTIDSYQRSCLRSTSFRWFVPAFKPLHAQASVVHCPSTVDSTHSVRTSASQTSIRILADHVDQRRFVRSFVPSRSFHLSLATSTDQGKESAGDSSTSADDSPPNAKPTHYDTLGVSPTASQEEVKIAYIRLREDQKPDSSNGFPKAVGEKLKKVDTAYAIIGHPENRRRYDCRKVECPGVRSNIGVPEIYPSLSESYAYFLFLNILYLFLSEYVGPR